MDKEARIVTQIAEAKNHGHKSTVAQLQNYVLSNTYIRIFDLDDGTGSTEMDSEKVPTACMPSSGATDCIAASQIALMRCSTSSACLLLSHVTQSAECTFHMWQ